MLELLGVGAHLRRTTCEEARHSQFAMNRTEAHQVHGKVQPQPQPQDRSGHPSLRLKSVSHILRRVRRVSRVGSLPWRSKWVCADDRDNQELSHPTSIPPPYSKARQGGIDVGVDARTISSNLGGCRILSARGCEGRPFGRGVYMEDASQSK